ncbi:MAG: hypothetical protein WC310_02855 [Patescibacteria group bacterium]|jgi:hypothetical protein
MAKEPWSDESITGPRVVPSNAEFVDVPTDPKVDEKIFIMSLVLRPGENQVDTEKIRDRFQRVVRHLAALEEELFAGFGEEMKKADLEELRDRFEKLVKEKAA